jgi:hypothetical protein
MESECFGESTGTYNLEGKDFLQEYKSVLNSKATEDSLVSLFYGILWYTNYHVSPLIIL